MDELKIPSSKRIQNFPDTETKDGVLIKRYSCGGVLDFCLGFAYAVSFKLKLPFTEALFDLYRLRVARVSRLLKDLRTFAPDVVLADPYIGYQAEILFRAQKTTGAKIMMRTALHIDFPGSDYSPKKLKRLAGLDAVMTNTEYERRFLIDCGVSAERIHVTGVGIDSQEWSAASADDGADISLQKKLSGKKYVLYLGRKQEGKGIETLIEAMQKVATRFPDAVLVLAGESTPYFDQKVAPLIKRHSFIENVGRVQGAVKRWLLQNAYIFSMVSNADSFGIVYLEAWLCKKPVIGADLGAMRCVIDEGKDGFLVPYGSADILAEKISALLQDASLAKSMGERGCEKAVGLYDHRVIGKKIEDLMLEISRKRP